MFRERYSDFFVQTEFLTQGAGNPSHLTHIGSDILEASDIGQTQPQTFNLRDMTHQETKEQKWNYVVV